MVLEEKRWRNGNRYSVPLGTYYGQGKTVKLAVQDDTLSIIEGETGEVLGKHRLSLEKGKLIQDRSHKRDRSKGIPQYMESVAQKFEQYDLATAFLDGIKVKYPRYLRDQLQLINRQWDSHSANELPEFIKVAEKQQLSYTQFLLQVMEYEKKRREEKVIEKYLKWANFPIQQTLDSFSLTDQPTIKTKQFNQLKDLGWLDQLYNLILLGPSGVGKTHIAIGLGIKAVQEGYRVTFVTMAEVIQLLKTEEISRKSQIRLKRLRESNLVIIDDLMFIAMDRREANLLFHLINHLYNAASVIITSNKGPSEWGELLGDPAIAAAIMDRLVHRSEVIQLKGDSYRVKHRTPNWLIST